MNGRAWDDGIALVRQAPDFASCLGIKGHDNFAAGAKQHFPPISGDDRGGRKRKRPLGFGISFGFPGNFPILGMEGKYSLQI